MSGPEGSLERLRVELIGLPPERVVAGPSPQLALGRYAAALSAPAGDTLVLATDPLGVPGELSERGRRRAYSIFLARHGELHLTHERLLNPHLAPLSCPAHLYLSLAERARLSLRAHLGSCSELLMWASDLAAEGGELPSASPWFTVSRGSLDLEARPYDLWLDVIALERRLERLSVGLGASDMERRALWASLMRKAQRELAAALGEVARVGLSSLDARRLALAGSLSADPRLCALARRHISATYAHIELVAFPSDHAVAAAAAGFGERLGAEEGPLGLARVGEVYTEAHASEALEAARPLLHTQALGQPELERLFAQQIAQGHAVARYEGRLSLTAHPTLSRALLVSPTLPSARAHLNEDLSQRPTHAPLYLICPEERSAQLFVDLRPSPLGRALATPRPELAEQIRPALCADGQALVITVSREQDAALVRLCESLLTHFNHPPLLLAAPLSQRSGRLVESPSEAARWLLGGRAVALVLGRRWVTRRGGAPPAPAPTLPLSERLAIRHPGLAAGLTAGLTPPPSGAPDARALSLMGATLWADVERLNAQIFSTDLAGDAWEDQALEELSRHLAPHRSGSRRFGDHPLHPRFEPALSGGATLLVHPRGLSRLIDDAGRWSARLYPWPETLALSQLLFDDTGRIERISRPLNATPREARRLASWALAELEAFGLRAHSAWRPPPHTAEAIVEVRGAPLLSPFQDPQFSLRGPLATLWERLRAAGYTEALLAPLQGAALPSPLPPGPAGALARLFWLGEELSRAEVLDALGEPSCHLLHQLGALWGEERLYARVAIDCVAGAYIASDMMGGVNSGRGRAEQERPCLPLSPLARGATYLATSRREGVALDASHTYGAVAVSLARSAKEVVTLAQDERALRFSRFNLQLNGVERGDVHIGVGVEALPQGPFSAIFSDSAELISRLGAHISPQGRVCVMSQDLTTLQGLSPLVPGRVLTLPLLCEPSVSVEDPRLYHGFGATMGYWIFEVSERSEIGPLSTQLHRPLSGLPSAGLEGFVEHVFALPRLTASAQGALSCAPHPQLTLTKRTRAQGRTEHIATNDRWPSLTPIALRDEVYAQVKSLSAQGQTAPLTPTGVALTLLGLKVLRGAERP